MLTLKRQSRSGSISRFLGNPVRIFHSLLFICALEVLFWSFCLFTCQSTVGWSGAARAYYTRETLNLKSTTGEALDAPVPAIDVRILELTLKAETAWHQRAFATLYAALNHLPLQQSSSVLAHSLLFPEKAFSTDSFSKSGAVLNFETE
ncbi:prasinophyte-specific protein [Micromonas commoda]|uniref:Prasinophyte-specific protein n=1 Tax=Micromonas commoda (strain RCC299 / NOUM17 / CCMP2709) TaxID=296587 RepID=C1FD59_MICCC|nr:prasinophyte-specific protein [Micromonas commoda]ACO68728.1 prasinophyte-specific protein [Micromonas commoda]|eukprot:XP_002507470.1 prasinophyte-specific protein [Micromonas commoda]